MQCCGPETNLDAGYVSKIDVSGPGLMENGKFERKMDSWALLWGPKHHSSGLSWTSRSVGVTRKIAGVPYCSGIDCRI